MMPVLLGFHLSQIVMPQPSLLCQSRGGQTLLFSIFYNIPPYGVIKSGGVEFLATHRFITEKIIPS